MSQLVARVDMVVVVKKLAEDLYVDTSTVGYVLKRFHHEGIKFLTVTLPKLAKSVLASLEAGVFLRPTDFQWKGRSLLYFRSLLDVLFDRKTGRVHENVDPVDVFRIRQFCEYFYKMAFAFTDDEICKAEEKYQETEKQLSQYYPDHDWVSCLRSNLHQAHKNLVNATVDSVLSHSRPRFGPGSFVGSSGVKSAFDVQHWAEYKQLPAAEIGTCTIDQEAFSGYFRPYPACKEPINLVYAKKESSVMFVPKDSRGPRVISKEPLHLLKMQMSFFDWSTEELERSSNYRINFVSQEVNRQLAQKGSITNEYATLDLKDASDRISLRLVREVFRYCPAIYYFISKVRSTHTGLPSLEGDTVFLHKLAGMGSGLTFPILALLVHLSICTRVQQKTGLTYTQVSRAVYVYGDDVVVPSQWYDYAVEGLARSNLLVNDQKSFRKSGFRESCGGDYYKGNQVNIARLRLASADLRVASSYGRVIPLKGKGVLQLERHCRELVKTQLVNLVEYLYSVIERGSKSKLPFVLETSPVLGRLTKDFNKVLDQPSTVRAFVPRAEKIVSSRQSPFAFLGSTLKTQRIPGEVIETARVGEISLPRHVLISQRKVHNHLLR